VGWTGGRSVSASEYWQVGKDEKTKTKQKQFLLPLNLFPLIGVQHFKVESKFWYNI
jgi:hypothetical protein